MDHFQYKNGILHGEGVSLADGRLLRLPFLCESVGDHIRYIRGESP